MIALGIDPGTRFLGWGVVSRNGNRLTHVAHGVIRAGTKEALPTRLLAIEQELTRVIEEHSPEVGSVESLFFHKDAQAAAKLGHARGVVLLCLERAQVKIFEHAPARVKRTLAGNGQADKRQVALMVRAVLGLDELPPADAADALALAVTQLRLDPRTLASGTPRSSRKSLPPHVMAAVQRAKAARG
jgi:crossover junction endodeoxyribonuclease RuvC